MVADQGAARSIRVCVRVRPQLPSDGITGTELLQLDNSNGVVLSSGSERRGGRRYAFDSVFGPEVAQDDLYMRAGVPEMVAAAAAGFHATVFAYGQTGSGKTYTMEGYRYVGAGSGGAGAAGTGTAAAAAAGSPAGKAGAARSVPHADFSSTPESQLGIIPRAVRDLFAAVAKNRDRRFTIKCSFVQIYREQVYDLLNPASLSPGQQQKQPQQRGGVAAAAAAGGPLKLRWSKAEEFYLENLFTPEVESAEEAMAVFQAGVANKVMSSHRLNAASSRSHCLFTLHVASCPAASPLELTASRLTLVDLAGSERAAHTGATEGALRDESVAINKSLFTLRQVITALTDAAAAAAAQAAAASAADGTPALSAAGPQSRAAPSAAAAGASPPPPPLPHIPYRDSKLTCLLKHSLGGNSWTLMLACLSPADRFYEENASTLDYAARARKITNQVAVNEDPRSRLIRELRAEVAFLRQQLEAAGTGAAGTGPGLGAGGAAAAAGPGAAQRFNAAAAAAAGAGAGATPGARGAAASGAPGAENGLAMGGAAGGAGAGGGLAGAGEDEEAVAKRLRTSDVEALVRSVIEASRVAVSSSTALAGLRAAYARTSAALEAMRAEHETLQAEDVRLRDRLALLESLVGASGPGGINIVGAGGTAGLGGGVDGSAGGAAAGAYTASTAAFIELEELRRENALLHERLQLLDPGGTQPLPLHTPGGGGGGGGVLGRAGGQAGGRATGTSRRPGAGATGGMPPRGAPAPSSPHAAASRGLNRAQSAGVLRASGRLPTAVASATANPFTPREVLLAVGATGHGAGPGSVTSTGRPPLTAGGGSGRTLTVEQLRSVLQMGSGGVGGAGGGGGGSPPPPTDPGSALLSPPQPQQHYAFADSRPSTSASALGGVSASSGGRLVELGHSVASRALGSGVRLSTTGKLLPAAPARMAVEAAGGGGSGLAGGTLQRPVTSSSSSFSFSQQGGYGPGEGRDRGPREEADDGEGGGGGIGEREAPLRVGSYSSGGPGLPAEAAALTQLLAERNAMTRHRLGAG